MNDREPAHLLPEPSNIDWQEQERRDALDADLDNDEAALAVIRESQRETETVENMLAALADAGPAYLRALGLCLYTRGRLDAMREAAERAAGVAS